MYIYGCMQFGVNSPTVCMIIQHIQELVAVCHMYICIGCRITVTKAGRDPEEIQKVSELLFFLTSSVE